MLTRCPDFICRGPATGFRLDKAGYPLRRFAAYVNSKAAIARAQQVPSVSSARDRLAMSYPSPPTCTPEDATP
jgi:hypothetical protein